VISFGEVAVGLGTLLGLFGRVAAFGGMLLSLSFFLTVSFNDNPYYYGPDIVFLFAWTPFVLAGSGTWSLDALFADRAARTRVAFQNAALRGGPAARRRVAEFDRRVFLQRVSAAGVVGLAGLVLGGFVAQHELPRADQHWICELIVDERSNELLGRSRAKGNAPWPDE
jgi:thiosulfate dehydrogenase [quinone] large subunit